MVCWRLQQKDSWGSLTENQQGKQKSLRLIQGFVSSKHKSEMLHGHKEKCWVFSIPLVLHDNRLKCLFPLPQFINSSHELFLIIRYSCFAGRRLPHPTQLGAELPPAVHPGRALPAEGVQHPHPLPGGHARLCPRKGGQEEWRGEDVFKGVGRDVSGRQMRRRRDKRKECSSVIISFIFISLRGSTVSTIWSLTTSKTNCYWSTARARPSTQHI